MCPPQTRRSPCVCRGCVAGYNIDVTIQIYNVQVVHFIEDHYGVTVTPLHVPELENCLGMFMSEVARSVSPRCLYQTPDM